MHLEFVGGVSGLVHSDQINTINLSYMAKYGGYIICNYNEATAGVTRLNLQMYRVNRLFIQQCGFSIYKTGLHHRYEMRGL